MVTVDQSVFDRMSGSRYETIEISRRPMRRHTFSHCEIPFYRGGVTIPSRGFAKKPVVKKLSTIQARVISIGVNSIEVGFRSSRNHFETSIPVLAHDVSPVAWIPMLRIRRIIADDALSSTHKEISPLHFYIVPRIDETSTPDLLLQYVKGDMTDANRQTRVSIMISWETENFHPDSGES